MEWLLPFYVISMLGISWVSYRRGRVDEFTKILKDIEEYEEGE